MSPVAKASRCATPRSCTTAEVTAWLTELSNWGRWGAGDQLGAANLITPQKRREAARLVREGVSVSMSRDVAENVPPASGSYLIRTVVQMNPGGATDKYEYNGTYHGATFTHLDAFCHHFVDGKVYNGFSVSATVLPGAGPGSGCLKNSIIGLKNGILTRGILFDATLLPNKASPEGWITPGTAIYAEELEALEKIEHVKMAPGDAIFLYTGRWKLEGAPGAARSPGTAGYYVDVAPLLKERGVSLIGNDWYNDAVPIGIVGGFPGSTVPLHTLTLVTMGIYVLDNMDLEELATKARQSRRYEFLFTALPLRVVAGMGSPLNPIATF